MKIKLGRDAWLLLAIAACALVCILLGMGEQQPSANEDEARLNRVLSAMEGAGTVESAVFYTQGDESVPCGAVIVAEGAQDISVRLKLIRAACTLLGLDASQVEVFKREGGR